MERKRRRKDRGKEGEDTNRILMKRSNRKMN